MTFSQKYDYYIPFPCSRIKICMKITTDLLYTFALLAKDLHEKTAREYIGRQMHHRVVIRPPFLSPDALCKIAYFLRGTI